MQQFPPNYVPYATPSFAILPPATLSRPVQGKSKRFGFLPLDCSLKSVNKFSSRSSRPSALHRTLFTIQKVAAISRPLVDMYKTYKSPSAQVRAQRTAVAPKPALFQKAHHALLRTCVQGGANYTTETNGS